MPSLDEETKEALNALTLQEVSMDRSYAYSHEILWYGVAAMAHMHLMYSAADVVRKSISLDEFIERYALNFRVLSGFQAPLRLIARDGIFVPRQVFFVKKGDSYSEWDAVTGIFSGDLRNRVRSPRWKDKEYAFALTDRKWSPSDLADKTLIEQGYRFGSDMWQACAEGFELFKNNVNMGFKYNDQPEYVTDLGRKLIEYYSRLAERTLPF